MRGHLYKNFFISRPIVIFVAVMQAIVSTSTIAMSTTKPDIEVFDEYSSMAVLFASISYFLLFFITGMACGDAFKADERATWINFSVSTPGAHRGQVLGKYCFLLILFGGVFLLCSITNLIASSFAPETNAFKPLVIVFSIELFLNMAQVPFIIRFGTDKGVAIKGTTFGIVISAMFIYLLFGDISFLTGDDDFSVIIMDLLKKDWLTGLAIGLPVIAVVTVVISYICSLALYRKGAENYED